MSLYRGDKTKRSFESRLEQVYFEPNTGCWLWPSYVNDLGYGFTIYGGKRMTAHRASYSHHFGPIPEGMGILHSCDVPSCINPKHLRPGTQKENASDALSRGRTARGSRLPQTKLTDAQRVAISRDIRSSYVIAKDYGVTEATIRRTKKSIEGSLWFHPSRVRN